MNKLFGRSEFSRFDISEIMRNAWRHHNGSGVFDRELGRPSSFRLSLRRAWHDAQMVVQSTIPKAVRAERIRKLSLDLTNLPAGETARAHRQRLIGQIALLSF